MDKDYRVTIKYMFYDVRDYYTNAISVSRMKEMFGKYVIVVSGYHDNFLHYSWSTNDFEYAERTVELMNETDSFKQSNMKAHVLPFSLVKYKYA